MAAADGDVSIGNDSRSLIVRLFHSAFDGPPGSYECSEDVGVNVLGLTARQAALQDPPRYYADEILTIAYEINNYSCDTDVTARLELTGTASGAGILDPTDECLSACLIPAGGRIIGAAQWDLLNHPAVQHESVRAAIAVVQPESFADTNPSNDEHLSAQWIDRMPQQDILLSVGTHDRNSGSASSILGKPTFGVVDVRLVSAHSDSQVPFSQSAAPVTITIANHGEQTEVVTARVIHSSSEQSDEPDLVSTHVSVAPGAQSSVVMDVPAARLSVGINDLTVRIATTNDSDLSDNTRSLSIQRMPRQAPYSISDVEIPDRLTPGDNALITVHLANDGQSPVAVLVDAQVGGASIANAPVSSEIINAGASGNVVLTWAIPDTFAPGDYRLVVSATDPQSPETASASFGKDIVVRDVHGGTITDVQVTPPVIFLGESTTVLVTFRNDGPTPREFPFDLFLGEGSQPVAHVSTGLLEPGAIGVARLLWESGSNIDPGEYELRVAGEFDELTTSITVIQPVLNVAITEASASRSTLVLGRNHSVEIRATVSNLGDQAARVTVNLYEAGNPDDVITSPVTNVLPGQSTEVVMEWPLPSDIAVGKYTLRLMADVDGDSQPDDNRREIPITVRGEYADDELIDIAVQPDPAFVGEDVNVSVSVYNPTGTPLSIPLSLETNGFQSSSNVRNPLVQSEQWATREFVWRTGNQSPGTFAVTASADFGEHTWNEIGAANRIATATKSVTLQQVDAEIVAMYTSPSSTASQGEPVTVSVEVRNNGRAAINVPVELTFPSADKAPERRSPRILPGETTTAQFTWNTRNYEPGRHSLYARLTGSGNITDGATVAEVQLLLTLPVMAATIETISTHPTPARVGDSVEITVVVRNDGPISANIPITIYYPSSHRQPETRSPLTQPGSTSVARFRWRTGNFEPGHYDFRVAIQARNGSGPVVSARTFTVELLPPEVDFAVLEFFPPDSDTPLERGQWVDITVKLQNLGRHAGRGSILLNDLTADKTLYIRDISLDPGESRVVTFVWKTLRHALGEHRLHVTANAEYDGNHLNDTSDTIKVFVFTDRNITLGVGAHLPLDHTFGEISQPDLIATATKSVTLQQVDAEIVAMYTSPSSTASQGEPVTVSVEVRNNGRAAINVPVELTFPSADKAPERKSPRILPGETTTVEFTWNTRNYEPGRHSLYARLTGSGNITDGATVAEVQLLLTPPVTAATIETISTHPTPARVGDSVEVTVVVRNDGPISANIPITIYYPSSHRQPETRSPLTQPGSTSVARFRWRTGNFEPGHYDFRVAIQARNGSGPVVSARTFTVELLPPEVDFAVLEFFPPDSDTPLERGQWVDITVKLQNLGRHAGRGSILLNDLTADKTLYIRDISLDPGESRVVTFVWKTLRHAIGEHRLQVIANANYDGNHLNDTSDTITVFVFSDRSITLVVGANVPLDYIIGEASEPTLITGAGEEATIALLSANPIAAGTLTGPDGFGSFVPVEVSNAEYLPVVSLTNEAERTITVYRLSRLARMEPHACARFQHALGHAEPSAVICPQTPTLVL